MDETITSTPRKSSHSTALSIGILLTCLAVVGHGFLPERRLSLDPTKDLANAFVMQSGDGAPADIQWVDQSRFHFACKFPKATVDQGCSFGYQLHNGNVDQGVDLSRFQTLNLAIRYSGNARYLRVAVRNFDPRFSKVEDLNSPKYNFVNIPARDLAQPVAISLGEFWVPEWWIDQYDLPRSLSHPDLSNATIFSIDLRGGDLSDTQHDIQIDNIEFVGHWISAELWYLGILCLWLILSTTYGISQWVRLRRRHREQRRKIDHLETEKENYRRLSTLDALTNVLNRHGIERFVEQLQITRTPASVVVIDIDHFKRVNDQRGHYGGDRVLRQMGDILRAHSRNTDGLGRWGGEEFVLVLPGASLSKAAELAEKLRQRIKDTNFIPEDPLPITASFGVAVSRAGENFDDAFQKADEALYLAKNRGRDCVVAAADDQMHKVTGARKSTWALISGRFKLHS
jgi:diguanylate cyclase (GGDEF)-like protein